MAIDGFTLVAQIVNFVLLLVLLRAFLYRPIKRVMAERERRIAEEHAEAERARAEAEERAADLQREREELERHRRERLAEIEREAEAERERHLNDARTEAEAARSAWREALAREQADLATNVRQEMVGVLADALQRGWRELADDDLQARAVQRFTQRLQHLDDTTRDDLGAAVQSDRVTFRTAFEPSDEQRESLLVAVRDALGGYGDGAAAASGKGKARVPDGTRALDARFVHDPDLLAGVALRAGDVRIGWSAQAHVDDLERVWRSASTPRTGATSADGTGAGGGEARGGGDAGGA